MPPPPTERRSFIQDFLFAQSLMQYPALTLMLVTRRDVGYRLLNPLKLIAVTGSLAVIAILSMPNNEAARPIDLLIFAFVAFLSGLAQRIRRWWDLNQNVQQHSYYIGSSAFDFEFLPDFVRRNRRVARYVDPLVFALIGVALLPISRALAIWLVFSAFCLKGQEDMVFRRQRNRDLDLSDSILIAEQQVKTLERMERTQDAPQHQPDAGVPTGMGDDIQGHIIISVKRRSQKSNENTIDI
jgi:hypothetical protein